MTLNIHTLRCTVVYSALEMEIRYAIVSSISVIYIAHSSDECNTLSSDRGIIYIILSISISIYLYIDLYLMYLNRIGPEVGHMSTELTFQVEAIFQLCPKIQALSFL